MYSFTYKGVDFGDIRCYIVGEVFQRMPQPRVNIHEFAQGDGGVTQGVSFSMRRIRLVVKMTAEPDDRESQMTTLINVLALSQAEGPGDLSIDMFPGKLYKNAKLVSDLSSSVRATMEEFTLEFVCDPWPVATEEEEVAELSTVSGSGVVITSNTLVAVEANWLIKNASGSPASGVALSNSKAGGSSIWGNPLPDGSWLRLSSETQMAEVSDDEGDTWEEVPANLSGVVPKMHPGENTVTVTGLDSLLSATYTPGYTT